MSPVNFMPSTTEFLIGILVIIVLFLIFRAVALWYWKVNEIVNLLKEIRSNTKKNSKEEEK